MHDTANKSLSKYHVDRTSLQRKAATRQSFGFHR